MDEVIKSEENIEFEEYDEDEEISYEQWNTIQQTVSVRGNDKKCQKTIKEAVFCTKKDLVLHFKSQLTPFREHCKNIKNQYLHLSTLKKHLGETEAIIHFDFSENYNCK